MHAVTRDVTRPSAATKVNLRVEGPEVRTARRAVAAYLTACGIREPDVVARHTARVVREILEAAQLEEGLIPEDLVERTLDRVASEYVDRTTRVPRDGCRKTPTPAHVKAILGALPDLWEGSEAASNRANGYLKKTGVVIVPAESPCPMARPSFGDGRPTPADRFLTGKRACGRFVANFLHACGRVVGRRPGSTQTA